MNFNKIYALGLRHIYLIMNSFSSFRLDLLANCPNLFRGYIKIFYFKLRYYSNTVGVILTAAVLYDFYLELV